MGLDLVEFVFAVENAFGLYIPEPEAAELVTPGLLIDYLVKRLPPTDTLQCLDQIAFYRIRKGAMLAFDRPRNAIRPNTPWSSLIPPKARRHSWELLRHAVGVPAWPKLSVWRPFTGDAETVGRTARFIATRCPTALKGSSKTWTPAEITEVITRLMVDQLGVTRFRMTDHFVRDLKLD
jgi:hypothetical protein